MGEDFEQFYAANIHALTVQVYAYVGDIDHAQDFTQEAQTPPDGSGSFVLPVRAPASYHGGGTAKVALDEAAPATPVPDTNPTNDHASAMITVGG